MRHVLVGLAVLLLAWACLGAVGVLPAPWTLTERTTNDAHRDTLVGGGGDEGARRGATLTGQGSARGRTGDGEAAEVSAPPPLPPEVRGTVPRGAVLRGRVVRTEARMPVEGARLLLVRPSPVASYLKASSAGRWDVLEARTGRDGRFAFLDVRPARGYVVRAQLPGSGVVSSQRQDLGERQVMDLGDLVFQASGSLEGRVLDREGNGIVGARVAVSWLVDSILGMVLADPDTLPEIEAEAHTGADGAFRLSGLEPGKKTIVIATAGHGGRVLVGVQAGSGEVTRIPDVTLGGEGVVAGRVEWDDGTPAAGARVFAGEPRPGKATLSSAVTGADGTFRIEHLDGLSTRLGVFVPGIPTEPGDSVPLGTLDVVLKLRTAGSLTGRVFAKDTGKPIERFGVRLEPADEEHWVARTLRQLVDGTLGPQGFLASDGRFRIPVVAHGNWRVVVSAQGFPEAKSAPVRVAPGAETDAGPIALAEGHHLSGRVVNSEGQPLARAALLLLNTRSVSRSDEQPDGVEVVWDPDDAPADALTDESGAFELPPQTPAVYALRVYHEFHQAETVLQVDLTRGAVTDLEVRLKPAGTVVLRALEADGQPAVGELVALVCRDGWSYWDESDESGEVRIQGVPPGLGIVRWAAIKDRLLFRKAMWNEDAAQRLSTYEQLLRGGVGPSGEVQVEAGRVNTFALQMPRRVEVTVRPPPVAPGEKLATQLYVAQRANFFSHWSTARDDGTFRVRLEVGVYDLQCFVGGGDWNSARVFQGIEIPDVPAHQVDLK